MIIALVALAWCAWILFFQPKSTSFHARAVLGAYARHDVNAIIRYQLPEEAALVPLTLSQQRRIHDEIVFPVIDRYMQSRNVTLQGPDQSMIGALRLSNPEGRTSDFGVQVYSHKGGAKILVTQGILSAWLCRYSMEHNVPLDPRNVYQAVLEGLDRDQATLESYGLKGLVSPHPLEGKLEFRTFSEIRQKQLARLKALDATSSSGGRSAPDRR